MAQRRMLARSLGCSDKFTAVPDIAGKNLAEFAQLLFCLLIPHTDDWGRMSGSPKAVKLSVHPSSHRPVEDFDAALSYLASVGLILRYTSNGEPAIQVINFEREQPGLRLERRTKSRWGEPPEIGANTQIPGSDWKCPALPGNDGVREGKVREDKNVRTGADAPLLVRFERFWTRYPRKDARKPALEEWRKLHPDDALTDAMIAALERHKQTRQWRDDHVIPHARTWLHQARWEDGASLPHDEPRDPLRDKAIFDCKTCGKIHRVTYDGNKPQFICTGVDIDAN